MIIMKKITKTLILIFFLNLTIFSQTVCRNSSQFPLYDSNILLIYNPDRMENVDSWIMFLTEYKYNVTEMPLPLALITPTLLRNYDLIILDSGTNDYTGELFTKQDAELIAEQGTPIIANGFSGWLINKLSDSNESKLYDKTSSLKISLEDYTLELFHLPYELQFINQTTFLLLEISEKYYNSTFFLASNNDFLKTMCYRFPDCAIGKYSGYEDNPSIFFSFIYNPEILSINGEKLYVNLVEDALGRSNERQISELNIITEADFFTEENNNISIYLSTIDKTPISAAINIFVNGSLQSQQYTDINGFYNFSYVPSAENLGTLNITVNFDGDRKHLSSSDTVIIQVKKPQITFLDLNGPTNGLVGQRLTYISTLTSSSGETITNMIITLYENTTFISQGFTDYRGRIEFSYLADKTGLVLLKCVFNGDRGYMNSSSAQLPCHISDPPRNNTFLELEQIPPVRVGDEFIITATLTDEQHNPISGRAVYITINGEIYLSALTDNEGKAFFPVNLSDLGKYYVQALYFGDETFRNSSSGIIPVNAELKHSKLALSVEKRAENIFILYILLLSEDDRPIADQPVLILADGVIIGNLTTNYEGAIIYNLNLGEDLKQVSVELKYEGFKPYIGCSLKYTIVNSSVSQPNLLLMLGIAAIALSAGGLTVILRKMQNTQQFI